MRLAEQFHQLILSRIGVLEFVHQNVFAVVENFGSRSEKFQAED